MHDTALKAASLFFEIYCNLKSKEILDIGSQNINGSIRDVLQPHHKYIGVDFTDGNGVDIVLDDPYTLPFPSNSIDIITCSSCFEHCEFFWLLFIEMLRVLKEDGLIYLNAPSNGSYHKFPIDAWRFYPDAGLSLEKWSHRSGYNAILLESFILYRKKSNWNDFVAIFLKDKNFLSHYNERIIDKWLDFYNGYKYDGSGISYNVNFTKNNEDQMIINKLRSKKN